MAFGYACYRAYYAAGGTVGMIGHPLSPTQYRTVNAVGAVVILLAAVVPLVAVTRVPPCGTGSRLDRRRRLLHALVDGVLRVFSVTGVHPTQLPATVWLSFDRRAAE